MAESAPIHPAAWDDARLLAACELQFQRRSGPGGQHRNKVETAVVLHHPATGLTAEANERRSQAENRSKALQRLRLKLALAVRSERSVADGPSPRWLARLNGMRLVVSPRHADFPALLAEALDVLHACDDDMPAAAARLRCTPSQLVRLLRAAPAALAQVNSLRRQRGWRDLQ